MLDVHPSRPRREGPLEETPTLRLGPVVGNDYVVLEGLSAGERLVVSGVQKIRDGAALDAKPLSPPERG